VSEKASAFAIQALRKLDKFGSAASITTTSCRPTSQYEVVAKFKSIEEMQAFHRALIECGRAVRELDEYDIEGADGNGGSVGPFSHDTGGGKRIIRSAKPLS
jgi:hypothetical protein